MSRKHSAIADHSILIGDHAVKRNVISSKGILKQYAILNYRSLAYTNASEENTIFHGSFNDTAVRNIRIGYLRRRCISGRSRVTLFP